MTTKIKSVLGEIVIKYDNTKQRVGSLKALDRIEKIASRCSHDCEGDQWYVIVRVPSAEVAEKVRAIVRKAPSDVGIWRDEVASAYTPTTARILASAGVKPVGGLGDVEDIDEPGVWRVAIIPGYGCRLEVFEARCSADGRFEPQWHEAEVSGSLVPLYAIIRGDYQ